MLYLSETYLYFVPPLKLKRILSAVAGFVQNILQEVAGSFSAAGETENDKAWDRGIAQSPDVAQFTPFHQAETNQVIRSAPIIDISLIQAQCTS